MDKWDYIKAISQLDPFVSGRYLLNLLNKYNKNNTQEINLEEAKEYYEWLLGAQSVENQNQNWF